MPDDMVTVLNVNHPGAENRVSAAKYAAMKAAYLGVLPIEEPGLTHAEAKAALLPRLPEELFPGGATAGWWMKTVQLDLEARGKIARAGKPLRFHRTE